MKRFILSLIILLFSIFPASASNDLLPAEQAFQLSVDRKEDGQIALNWTIADDYYLYREQFSANDPLSGASIKLDIPKGIEVDDENFGLSHVFYNSVQALIIPENATSVSVSYQGCKENSICYPPVRQTVDLLTLKVSEPAIGFGLPSVAEPQENIAVQPQADDQTFQITAEAASGGMIQSLLTNGGTYWVIASFLMFGLLLAFTPCVLPMYPILSATLAREGEKLTAGRGFFLSLTYVLSMAVAFGFLGIAAAFSGQNLQLVLQSPYAVGSVAVIFLILAASMFGLFSLQLPSFWVNRISSAKGGKRGSFGGAAIIGFTSALIVGPCVTAPLAAALLYIAQTGDAWLGASALFALGLGQGLPLIVFGSLGGKALPRSGAWMTHVNHVFGFVFLGAAIWMAERILPAQVTMILWTGLLLMAAVFVGAFNSLTDTATTGQKTRKALGLTMALYAIILAVGTASGGNDPLKPLGHWFNGQNYSSSTASLAFTNVGSSSALKSQLALSGEANVPTLVYFTADWCVTCKSIERNVLPSQEIVAGLQDFRALKVDLSELNDDNRKLMQDLAVIGPPTMIFFAAGGKESEETRLIGEIDVDAMLASAAKTRD